VTLKKKQTQTASSYAEMMEDAGRGLAEIVNEITFDDEWEQALVFVAFLVASTHLPCGSRHFAGKVALLLGFL